MSDDTYVVMFKRRYITKTDIETEDVYLVAIQYNPYNKSRSTDQRIECIEDPNDAFEFTEKAAAEFAAVYVGGFVETLTQAKEKYKAAQENVA